MKRTINVDGEINIDHLEDEKGTVYAFGIPEKMDDVEVETVIDMLDHRFDHAGWMVVNLPIEEGYRIDELEDEQVERIINPDEIVDEVVDDG